MAQCLTPVIVKSDRKLSSDYATSIFPCGKCPACLQRRANGWTFRLHQQQKVSETSCFVTFTYSNEKLPISFNGLPTLRRIDYQKFMKRLRKRISDWSEEEQPKIKYYAVGEYGGVTCRPHYHAIMFNVPRFFMDNPLAMADIWSFGHVHIDSCNVRSIAYVTKYMMKTMLNSHREDWDDREEEKSMMSKGMGINYLSDAVKNHYKEHLIPYIVKEGGEKQSMPRYYREKIYTDEERQVIARKSLAYLEHTEPFNNAQHEMDWKKVQFYKQEKKDKERNKI